MFKILALVLLLGMMGCTNTSVPDNKNEQHVYSQKELIDILKPILRSEGKIYKKFKKTLAKEAIEGEEVQTITKDGLETINTAKAGDYIIKNLTEAGEMYIVGSEKFHRLYEFLEEGPDGFSVYSPKGKIVGVELDEDLMKRLDFEDEFYFIAKWNEKMIVKKGDYLASPPDYSEVYRIARKEFFETYQPDE